MKLKKQIVYRFSFIGDVFEFDEPVAEEESFVVEETEKNGQEDCHFAVEFFRENGCLSCIEFEEDDCHWDDYYLKDIIKMAKSLEKTKVISDWISFGKNKA